MLFDAFRTVEAAFDEKKWGLIAKEVRKLGGLEYEKEVCQRQFRRLLEKDGFDVDAGERRGDVDFQSDFTLQSEGFDADEEHDDDEVKRQAKNQPIVEWDGFISPEDEDVDAEGEADSDYAV